MLAADRIAAFSGDAEACAGERRAYCAGGTIPVLDLTGPAMLGDALQAYAGAPNRALREAAGERADDASTWASATTVKDVTVLPYCGFAGGAAAARTSRRRRRCVLPPRIRHRVAADQVPAFWHNRMRPIGPNGGGGGYIEVLVRIEPTPQVDPDPERGFEQLAACKTLASIID